VIRLERVTVRFADGREGLSELTLDVEAGSFNFLTGHSGAGKTTLIRVLLGLEPVTRGRVQVAGDDLARLGRRALALHRRRIGAVFQEHHLLPARTAVENVALPLHIDGRLGDEECARRARAALNLVGLGGREQALPRQLSLGEQQRVAIARAVVARPQLLLADEPTGNLDPALALDVLTLFRRFHEIGTTVLIATHDLRLMREVEARHIALDNGRLA
jgi:cell division transport system ATP-binding protein